MQTSNTVTKESITSKIVKVEYHQHAGTTLTFCVLTLENGFTITGESACADPTNFNAEIGQKIAYDNAFSKAWALEGYLLKERMYRAAQPAVGVVE